MERNFYPENFEKFLKGQADQFKMMPSKKAWHGIYNDLHPGRRWPSVTMSLVFIFSLVIIGHLNTNNEHSVRHNAIAAAKTLALKTGAAKNKTHIYPVRKEDIISDDVSLHIAPENNITTENTSFLKISSVSNTNEENALALNITDIHTPVKIENTSTQNLINKTTAPSSVNQSDNKISQSPDVSETEKDANTLSAVEKNESVSAKENIKIKKANTAEIVKIKKVRINPAIFTYYFTPSLSYRKFSDSKMNNSVTHRPVIGYEAGTFLNVNIAKQLQFTTGLQFNYSGYKIKASHSHPILASLLLNSELPGQTISYTTMSQYGNGSGNEQTNLKNYSAQVSVPIGLKYTFGSNENLEFNLEASMQPTYMFKGRSYLLSTDSKNYLTDPNIFRRLNINTAVSGYFSFQSNSLNWQIGPQVRYQLFSTYLKTYQLKEHLINYGIRIGVSKILQ